MSEQQPSKEDGDAIELELQSMRSSRNHLQRIVNAVAKASQRNQSEETVAQSVERVIAASGQKDELIDRLNAACAEKDQEIAELRSARDNLVRDANLRVEHIAELAAVQAKQKDQEIERLKAEIKDWNYELERRIAEGTTIIRMELADSRQRLATLEALLERVPHADNCRYPDGHPDCPRCAYEKLKAQSPEVKG